MIGNKLMSDSYVVGNYLKAGWGKYLALKKYQGRLN